MKFAACAGTGKLKIQQLHTTAFFIPEEHVKNSDERFIVLHQIALSVVGAQRGTHPIHVFHYQSAPVTRMLKSAWMRARKAVDFERIRVHDLKHTFGRRKHEDFQSDLYFHNLIKSVAYALPTSVCASKRQLLEHKNGTVPQ